MGGRLGYRFQAEKREHGAVQAELDAASEAFRECERRDVKLREDAKHLGAKARKLREKQARDAAKAQARARCPCSAAADLPDSFCLYQAVLRQVLRVCICITGGVRGGVVILDVRCPWTGQLLGGRQALGKQISA